MMHESSKLVNDTINMRTIMDKSNDIRLCGPDNPDNIFNSLPG